MKCNLSNFSFIFVSLVQYVDLSGEHLRDIVFKMSVQGGTFIVGFTMGFFMANM